MYLLLVDNNDISSREIKILLDKFKVSCDIINSSSSKALIDLAEKLMPDIVIVDFNLFSDDPSDIVRKLRQSSPHAYILAFVDQEHYHKLYQAVEEGVNDYLVKPLQREDVMLRIKMGLQGRKLFTEKADLHEQQPENEEIKYGSLEDDNTVITEEEVEEEKDYDNIRLISNTQYSMSKDKSREEPIEGETAMYESLAAKARLIAAENPEQAVELYQRAIDLYSREYLAESIDAEKTTTIRSDHHEFFIRCVYELADLLNVQHAYDKVIALCDMALAIDYFEEGLHIRLIEALIAEGMIARARSHYDEATSAFYREMGVKPSIEMKKLFEQGGLDAGGVEFDLSTIQNGLKSNNLSNGALYCDLEQFRYSYKLEQLRCERNGQSVLLCMVMLITRDYSKPPDYMLQEVMHNLKDVIIRSLRKGDLVTRWNNGQFLLMLPGLNREQASGVMDRIEQTFLGQYSLKGLQMQKKVETLFPLEGDAHFN